MVISSFFRGMIARPAVNAGGKDSQGPAWGLKEQLGRLGKNHGGGRSSAGEQHQDRAERSKIRVSVTGPALALKIEQVRFLSYPRKEKLSFILDSLGLVLLVGWCFDSLNS